MGRSLPDFLLGAFGPKPQRAQKLHGLSMVQMVRQWKLTGLTLTSGSLPMV